MQKQKELESTKPRGPLDLHAIIKELAEAVLECHSGLAHDYGTCAAGCEDGNYIPFKALRVACPCLGLLQYGSDGINHWYDRAGCKRCYLSLKHTDCAICQGRGWVPEPDLERACWRLHEMGFEGETKEAVLSAASAWFKSHDRR